VKRGQLQLIPVILALTVIPILAACSAGSSEGLPKYAYRSAASLEGYKIAVAHPDLLAQMPCYCGCGSDPAFKNLRDCFLNENGEFNAHAANCMICIEEAKDASKWQNEGLSVKQIRERIDQDYQGRGNPTDTPPVTE